MKYLKKFNESNSSDWYEKISYDEYIDWITSKGQYGKPMSFKDSEILNIKSCLSKNDRFKLIKNGPGSYNPKGELISIGLSPYGSWYNRKVKSSLIITKYSDDWILCQAGDSFYKCDTIDGLTQLIRDINTPLLKESIESDSEYYETITLDDYTYVIHDVKKEIFSKRDIKYITSNISQMDNVYNLPKSGKNQILSISRPCSRGYNHYGWIYRINICKCVDEWFYCQFEKVIGKHGKDNSYYKCDGLEGVVRLMDKLIYNK